MRRRKGGAGGEGEERKLTNVTSNRRLNKISLTRLTHTIIMALPLPTIENEQRIVH
jgi:hypothetical protein